MMNNFDPEMEERRLKRAWSTHESDREIELGTRLDGSSLSIPASAFDRHVHVMGTTGGGKSYLLRHIFHQLAENNDSALVFFDPSGDAYYRLKRWAYSESLDSRLVLIDPSEQRMICGVNPVAPWPDNHFLQAALGWDTLRRAMDDVEFAPTPLLDQWMCNALYGLISTGLTLNEAPRLLAYDGQDFREAVIDRIPNSDVKSDFLLLNQLISQQRPGPAIREWQSQASAAYRRMRDYAWNKYLRRMLGTTEHVLDWGEVLEQRKIVLVNLNPMGQRQRFLSPGDVRKFGIQLLSQLVDECFSRVEAGGDSAFPCYCFVDEFQHFVSTNVERVLAEGRKFNLRLILAHRSLAELYNRRTGDDVLHELVAGCTQLKFAFGGLDWKDSEKAAWTMAAHHVDLDEVKDEIKTWSQLHHVEMVESSTESFGGSEQEAHSSASGKSELHNPDLDQIMSGESSVFADAMGKVSGWSSSSSIGPMVVPDEPVLRVTGRTFRSVEEQMHRVTSQFIRQPDQHAVVAIKKEEPIPFKVATLHDSPITVDQAREIDLELMRSLPYYATPELIEEEIKDRQSNLLASTKRIITPTPLRPEHRTSKKSPPKKHRGRGSK